MDVPIKAMKTKSNFENRLREGAIRREDPYR
jgi:hypothetical protein